MKTDDLLIRIVKAKMYDQETLDSLMENLLKYFNKADVAMHNGNNIQLGISYGAAHATFEALDQFIRETGLLPSRWKTKGGSDG